MLLNAEINELSKFVALRQICRSKTHISTGQQRITTTTTTKTITTTRTTTTTTTSSLAGCKFPSIRHREIIILHACRVYRVVKKLRTKIHIHRGDWLIPSPPLCSRPRRLRRFGAQAVQFPRPTIKPAPRDVADGSVYWRAFSSSRAPLTEEGFAFAALLDLPRHLVKHAHV